ncbi:MAG: DinB family protein, partial [Thermoanaerobaculia bacterium]
MTIAEIYLREFDSEMEATRRLLDRLPSDRLDWTPHPKSRSLGQLATHIAELPRWGLRIEGTSWAVGSEKAPALNTAAEFLTRFDENVRAGRASIAAKTDGQLRERLTVTREGKTFFELPKVSILRRVLLNHLIHHRGQLTVYLRLNGVALPAIYGPTADEQ